MNNDKCVVKRWMSSGGSAISFYDMKCSRTSEVTDVIDRSVVARRMTFGAGAPAQCAAVHLTRAGRMQRPPERCHA